MNPFSLAILLTHPTQFDGPLFGKIVRTGLFDLHVYYLETDRIGTQADPELGFSPNWDIPVTSGYRLACCPRGFFRRLLFLRQECFTGSKYDLVIVPGYARLDIALLASLFRKQALGMRLDTVTIYTVPRSKAWLKRILLTRLFRRYVVFHPVGSLTEGFLQELGISRSLMFRFPYAVDNEYLSARADGFRRERDKLLEDLGISSQTFVVLGVLKFVPRENPMDLLRGFHAFHRRVPNSALLLVGTGALEEEMRSYISAAGLSAAVRLVGYAKYSELPKWYAISDVVVHPAVWECWGVSVNEAMACGLPVVTSDRVGSAYDLVREGLNGYTYPSGDAALLAERLEKIASQPDRGRRMGERSQGIVAGWNYEKTAASLMAALLKVAGKTIPPGLAPTSESLQMGPFDLRSSS